PDGGAEAGMAGAFQGSPVGLVKARTVDALAVADAEVVFEGSVNPVIAALKPRSLRKPESRGDSTSTLNGQVTWAKPTKPQLSTLPRSPRGAARVNQLFSPSAFIRSTTTTSIRPCAKRRCSNSANGCSRASSWT